MFPPPLLVLKIKNYEFFCFFCFFFEKPVRHFYYVNIKLLSSNTKLVTSQWMSSNHIWGLYNNFANLASLLATILPLHLTCVKEAFLKLEISRCESSMIWPKAARQGESNIRCLWMISESPLNTTSSNLSSMEKEMALLHAKASTSSTVGGKAMWSDNTAITIPLESRTTALKPATPEFLKIAPSLLALYWFGGRGSQWVGWATTCCCTELSCAIWNSWSRLTASL